MSCSRRSSVREGVGGGVCLETVKGPTREPCPCRAVSWVWLPGPSCQEREGCRLPGHQRHLGNLNRVWGEVSQHKLKTGGIHFPSAGWLAQGSRQREMAASTASGLGQERMQPGAMSPQQSVTPRCRYYEEGRI
jgi:hypothetical protein